ncbi:MAG: VOC family protein [bacterium]
MVKNFLHVKIDVEDLDRSLDFYFNKLGFKQIVRYDVPNGPTIVQVYPTGASPGIELWYQPPFRGFKNDRIHIALEAEDVEGTVLELRAKGIFIEREPFTLGDEVIAFIRDPDGYLVELSEVRTPRAG